MTEISPAMCKVLVYEGNPDYNNRIKIFCENNDLIAVKTCHTNILDVLKSNIDLGAIFLSENIEENEGAGIKLGEKIHELRPELPIILRREACSIFMCMEDEKKKSFCVSYCIDEIDSLRPVIEEHIFSAHYPNALIRGIEEITADSLNSFFDDIELEVSVPYLVKDRIIYGELFSLIPIDSEWCRGYMTLQSEMNNVLDIVKGDKVDAHSHENFRVVNDVLSEVTNLIWGGIKSRFITDIDRPVSGGVQIPIIVSHTNNYITFGTDMPQLCFKYTVHQKSTGKQFSLYQKFIFNLSWEPEKFSENTPTVDDLLDSGELEMF